jgi:Neuraminidase (sialidase)
MRKKQKLGFAVLLLIYLIVTSSFPAISQSEVQSWIKHRLTRNGGDSRLSSMAVSGDNIHVVWQDDTPGNYDVYYKRSRDNGATWGKPKRLISNAGGSYFPSIAVSGRNIHVVWFDDTPESSVIYYKRSKDNGVTWSKMKRITSVASDFSRPSIAASGRNIHVAWDDGYPGDIFYRRSSDNGATWKKKMRLVRNRGDSSRPFIAVSGRNIHVVWDDDTPGSHVIFYRKSTNHGRTWFKKKRLSHNASDSFSPTIAVTGSNIHVAWCDKVPGEIYYKRSSNNGATWMKTKRLTQNAGSSFSPSIDVWGGIVYVAWEDSTPGNYEIYYKRSSDSGATWERQRRLTRYAGASKNPHAALSASNIHIVWDDMVPGNHEIFYKRGP